MYEELQAGVQERIQESEGLRNKLASLVIFGSYIRGDYIPGQSDMDFFAVFKEYEDKTLEELQNSLVKETEELNPKRIDLL